MESHDIRFDRRRDSWTERQRGRRSCCKRRKAKAAGGGSDESEFPEHGFLRKKQCNL